MRPAKSSLRDIPGVGPRTAAVMEALAEAGNTWQKNTVITLLSRLVDKGMLKTGKIGRRNEYIALVSERTTSPPRPGRW